MKRSVIVLVALFLSLVPASAGKIVTDSLDSKILNAQVKYNVYLPDGFEKSDAKYPLVCLLHGLYGNYKSWADHCKPIADELIGSQEACPMVILMPNAGGKDAHKIHNGYFNVDGWNYEDFFFNELLPLVEEKYRCGGSKGQRAIMGLSMGGGGSTVYAQTHPDMFSSCYAMSAWMDQSLDNGGRKVDPNDFFVLTCKSVHEHSTVAFLENADDATKEKLRTVRWFVDCGDDDFLLDVNVKFYQLMRNSKIKTEFRVRNGVHNWEYWHGALRLALPFVTRGFYED